MEPFSCELNQLSDTEYQLQHAVIQQQGPVDVNIYGLTTTFDLVYFTAKVSKSKHENQFECKLQSTVHSDSLRNV